MRRIALLFVLVALTSCASLEKQDSSRLPAAINRLFVVTCQTPDKQPHSHCGSRVVFENDVVQLFGITGVLGSQMGAMVGCTVQPLADGEACAQ